MSYVPCGSVERDEMLREIGVSSFDDLLDAILNANIEQRLGVEAIVALGFERQLVVRVVRMLQLAEYKRRQAPPGVKITERAFGRDRRYPITHGFSG